MSIKEIGEKAKKALVEFTGFRSPALIGARKESPNWAFSIELVEKQSIPEGMDVLGLYEVRTDPQGNVTGYERKSTRRRIDNVSEEESISR